jgi:ATP-dependent DNA helicase RecG
VARAAGADAAAASGLEAWGLGETVLERLARLGIGSPADALLHLPLRYDDETRVVPIREAAAGAPVQVEGTVVANEILYRPRRQLVCRIADASGEVYARFLNFYPNQVKTLAVGRRVRLFGELRPGFFGAEMVHPRFRAVAAGEPLPEALTPVYPTTAGLPQYTLRRLAARALKSADLAETVPDEILGRLRLPPFADAVRHLHHPPPREPIGPLLERAHPTWRRMKFDELLAQQLSMRLHYRERRARNAPRLAPQGELARRLADSLPFRLTAAQRRVLEEIRRDLAEPHPMQRLLQGDVGSGKTIVAALAACQAVESGFQVAIMAPTEILAEQHHRKLSAWLAPLGVAVAWLAGSQKKRERDAALAAVAEGRAAVAVGTHALFQEQVAFAKLGLAVVDEQHRFGVHQRLQLRAKGRARAGGAATTPHLLMMSATPIPRTLAMSFYADLDVSVIDELPPGRAPVATKLVSDARRDEVIARLRAACAEGRQAYWVCPLIEETGGAEGEDDGPRREPSARQRARREKLELQNATETFERLRATFPELRVGLVHGRLPPAEKAAVMAAFAAGEVQLLVATTVIEVGVDVPNASLMVIDHAERMGLSQLHQLRGRIGRGAAQSACILLYSAPLSQSARERLKVIYESADGFEIARHDLRIRGPGEFLGARQSGAPMLRFADLERDQDLLEAARDAAQPMLSRHPEAAARHLERWLGTRQAYLKV